MSEIVKAIDESYSEPKAQRAITRILRPIVHRQSLVDLVRVRSAAFVKKHFEHMIS